MYLLVVLACLSTDPDRCETHALGVIPDRSAEACQINSRQRVRAWAKGEEELSLQSWSCQAWPREEG